MTDKDAVQNASEAFYAALNSVFNKDPDPMREVWLQSEEVTAMRPDGGREIGWKALWLAWQQAAEVFQGGKVDMTERKIVTLGDFAYETGLEKGVFFPGGRRVEVAHRATNIYLSGAQGWKIVHHHTDKSDGAIAVFKQNLDTQPLC
ncbi:MAG: nuclear transport factor 2 family protein [Pseudomonadota bacterium]